MRKVRIMAPVQIINLEKNDTSDLLPLTYPTGLDNQFWIWSQIPYVI
jgi:hypothetical protein